MVKKLILLFVISGLSFSAFATEGDGGKDKPRAKLGTLKIRERKARPDIPGTFLVELGWNVQMSSPSELDNTLLGSRTVNLYYFYNIELPFAGGRFELMPGIGLGLDRFKFEDDVTIVEALDDNGNEFFDVVELEDQDVKKSMLISNYIDIPLELRFYSNPNDKRKSFKAGIGFKAGILYSAHTKTKIDDGGIEKTKIYDDFGLNRFRYGITGRIGVGGFNLFYYYSLQDLYEKNEGPLNSDVHHVTVGLSFIGF